MSMYTKIVENQQKTPEQRKQEALEQKRKDELMHAYTHEQIGLRKKFKKNHKRR